MSAIDCAVCWERSDPESGRGQFLASLKRIGYDASSMWVKAEAKPAAKKAAKPAPKKAAKKGGRK